MRLPQLKRHVGSSLPLLGQRLELRPTSQLELGAVPGTVSVIVTYCEKLVTKWVSNPGKLPDLRLNIISVIYMK